MNVLRRGCDEAVVHGQNHEDDFVIRVMELPSIVTLTEMKS